MDNLNRQGIRENTQKVVDGLDKQKLDNIVKEMERESLLEAHYDSIRQLEKHALCQGKVILQCDKSEEVSKCNTTCETPKVENEVVHGSDCHCSRCCPTPSWLQKNKSNIFLTVLWVAMIILAIGWSPSGKTFDAIQTSYVELIVDFFKMGIFAIAGVCTFKLIRNKK